MGPEARRGGGGGSRVPGPRRRRPRDEAVAHLALLPHDPVARSLLRGVGEGKGQKSQGDPFVWTMKGK